MDESKPLLDRLNSRIRNNPVAASLIILVTVVIALSSFTDAASKLFAMVIRHTRPDINGEWVADATYDWQNARYNETFTFAGEGEDIHGTASFLGTKRGILEGKVTKDKIQFTTRTQEVLGDRRTPRDVVHRYEGKVARDEIRFVMQPEGGFSEHVPIEFTARKNAPSTTR